MTATILIKGRGIRDERIAGGTIIPGQLVAQNSSGNWIVHPTIGAAANVGPAGRVFAVEDDNFGRGIDDSYVVNDFVQAEWMTSGCQIYALVSAAAAAIVKGDYLMSAGNGNLAKAVAGAYIVAIANEAVDNSGGGANARIRVIVI